MFPVAILVALLTALSGCAGANPAGPTELSVVVLGSMSHAPLFIADEAGFFADQGIVLDRMTFRRTAAGLPALAAGDLDVYIGTLAPSLLNVIARTDNVRFVLARTGLRPEGCAAYALLAQRELIESGRLKQPRDLAGLRIGTERTSSNFYIINMLLNSGGLTPDDVETTYIPYRLKPEGFARNLMDVSTSSEPWMTRIIEGGSAVQWIPTRDVVPGFQYGFMLFGPSLLEDNREAARRFVTAYMRGVRQYNTDGKTEQHLEILSRNLRLEPDLLRRVCWPHQQNDGHVDLEQLERYQTWAIGEGLVDRKLTGDQLWDRSFVDHANGVLGEVE
jgi:NitT/TauT family transport system substrate-binding protein